MTAMSTDRSLSKAVRLWRKRNLSKLLPKRAKTLIALTADNGTPILNQLRALLADKKTAARLVEQLEVWRCEPVTRKEFRRAIAALGYSAPKDDLNAMFDEIDTVGTGEIDFDQLREALQRIESGLAPERTGKEARAARAAAKAAKKKAAKRVAFVSAPAARVLPPAARPPPLKIFSSFENVSPAMMRAAGAVSPAIKRVAGAVSPAMKRAAGSVSPAIRRAAGSVSPAMKRAVTHTLSAISPAGAKAMGVSELYDLFSPDSADRLGKWAAVARLEKAAAAPVPPPGLVKLDSLLAAKWSQHARQEPVLSGLRESREHVF